MQKCDAHQAEAVAAETGMPFGATRVVQRPRPSPLLDKEDQEPQRRADVTVHPQKLGVHQAQPVVAIQIYFQFRSWVEEFDNWDRGVRDRSDVPEAGLRKEPLKPPGRSLGQSH